MDEHLALGGAKPLSRRCHREKPQGPGELRKLEIHHDAPVFVTGASAKPNRRGLHALRLDRVETEGFSGLSLLVPPWMQPLQAQGHLGQKRDVAVTGLHPISSFYIT